MKPLVSTAIILVTAQIISGCANTAAGYRPLVDGMRAKNFEMDLFACQELATERSYLNDDVKSEALLGSGIGSLIGAAGEGLDGAIVGAILGGVAGTASRAWETREERKKVVIECMKQRGHKVVG